MTKAWWVTAAGLVAAVGAGCGSPSNASPSASGGSEISGLQLTKNFWTTPEDKGCRNILQFAEDSFFYEELCTAAPGLRNAMATQGGYQHVQNSGVTLNLQLRTCPTFAPEASASVTAEGQGLLLNLASSALKLSPTPFAELSAGEEYQVHFGCITDGGFSAHGWE